MSKKSEKTISQLQSKRTKLKKVKGEKRFKMLVAFIRALKKLV